MFTVATTSAVVVYLFWRYIPSLHERSERQTNAFLSALADERKSREEVMRNAIASISELKASNAELKQTVSGLQQTVNQLITVMARKP